ncbi:MAG TPA: NYN domain-containing protein [Thermoanaerobaculia bacterium]|jgi:uncharacterized protein (TIGR00288 family)
MRPTAEGLEEENRNKPKSQTPQAAQAPQADHAAEPTPPVAAHTFPEPQREQPSFSEAPREWRPTPAPEPAVEPAVEMQPMAAASSHAPLPVFPVLEPLDDEAEEPYDDEEGSEEELEAGEAEGKEGEEKEGDDKDAEERRRRRSRGRRGGRRRNGKAAAASAAPAKPAEEEDEDEEPWRDEPAFEEPAPAPRRIAHTPSPSRYVISPSEVESVAREIVISVPERQRADHERKIAMFCDFENIALGVRDSEISKFDITLVLERLVEKGKIIVKKAYADWERYSDYKRPFHESAIELIDIPQKYYSGKNSADIKMVVDAMDLSYSKEHLDTFVLLSGDSDFSPLVSKLKENNKYVIGIGVKNSSSNLLVDNCDEFIYYEDVWRDSQKGPKLDGLNKKTAEAFSLMIESIQALIRENKDVLWGSMIKQTMQRKRPSFNEGYYGYSTFSELLEDAERKQIIKLKKDQRSGTYIVTGFAKTGEGMTATSRR